MNTLELFVSRTIEKLKLKGFTEEQLKKQEKRLMKEYSFLENKIRVVSEEIPEYSQEERIAFWKQHYSDLEKDEGIYVFTREEQLEDMGIDTKLNYGRTQLHEAVNNKDIQRIIILLENKADASIKDNSGLTPLHIAKLNGDKEIVEIFKKRGIEK